MEASHDDLQSNECAVWATCIYLLWPCYNLPHWWSCYAIDPLPVALISCCTLCMSEMCLLPSWYKRWMNQKQYKMLILFVFFFFFFCLHVSELTWEHWVKQTIQLKLGFSLLK
jgi:hypothetical protein